MSCVSLLRGSVEIYPTGNVPPSYSLSCMGAIRDFLMIYTKNDMHHLTTQTKLQLSMQPKPAATPPSSLLSPLVRSR